MTHDPLCYMAESKWDGGCQCDLIAKVRTDERSKDDREDDSDAADEAIQAREQSANTTVDGSTSFGGIPVPADQYTYTVMWSAGDNGFVATVAEFPSLSWVSSTQAESLDGLTALVGEVLCNIVAEDQPAPSPHRNGTTSVHVTLDAAARMVDDAIGNRIAELNECGRVDDCQLKAEGARLALDDALLALTEGALPVRQNPRPTQMWGNPRGEVS